MLDILRDENVKKARRVKEKARARNLKGCRTRLYPKSEKVNRSPFSYSSSLSSSSLWAFSSHSRNFSAAFLTFLLVLRSTYFLLALLPHALTTSSVIISA